MGDTVIIRIKRLSRREGLGLAAEALLFAMFFVAFWFLLTLRTPASNWAMIPHVLCNAGLLLMVLRHYAEGRQPLYWSHFDAVVIALFAFIALNVYYSEVRVVSWRVAALYLDSAAAYMFGRLLFYRRVRAYVIALLVALAVVYLSAIILRHRLAQQSEPDEAMIQKLSQILRVVTLMAAFWLLALPFLLFKKPGNLLFLIFAAALLTGYAMLVTKRLGWLFAPAMEVENIEWRHQRFLTLETAWRIVRHYPLTGSGLGTFPIMFEAFKQAPTVPYVASFNAYLYSIVELGIAGLALFLYLFVRFPLHILRRWRLFPNRRLRMAVYVFFWFAVLVLFQGFYDSDIFSPGAWFLIWTNFGVLMSLVMVRDPVRLFEAPFAPKSRQDEPGAPPQPQHVLNWLVWIKVTGLTAVVMLLIAAELAPYVSATLARKRPDEEIASASYGQRLERAVRIFPLNGDVWAKLANHYQQQVKDDLAIYTYMERIEDAYNRAIRLNPYDPRNYEQLAFLYSDTNNPGKALEVLKEGTRNNPNHFVLRLLLVRELERTGSLALATYHVKQALFRIAPDQVELYLRLAELYERRGMRERALRYLQYAKQVVPDTPQTAARLRRLGERLKG